MHRDLLIDLAGALLVGCSSASVDPSSAKRVPTDLVYAYQVEVLWARH